MPAVEYVPPQPGTYRFVLVLDGKDHRLPWTEYGYSEKATSRALPLGHSGVMVPALFVREQAFRDRLVRVGWRDVTDAWNRRPCWRDPWVPPEARPFADLDRVQAALLDVALTGTLVGRDWHGGGRMAQECGTTCTPDEARAALDVLVKAGLLLRAAERGPMANRYAATPMALARAGVPALEAVPVPDAPPVAAEG